MVTTQTQVDDLAVCARRILHLFMNEATGQADILRIEALGMSRLGRTNDPKLNLIILMMQRRIDEAAAFLEQFDEHLFALKDALDQHDKKAKKKR